VKGLFLLCMIILTAFFSCPSAEGAAWILFGKNNRGTAYYDMAGIEQLSTNVIRVSVKYAYSPEGVKEFKEAFPYLQGSETVSYSVYRYEINCSAGSFMQLEAATYDPSDSALKGTELSLKGAEEPIWEHITPHSLMEQLSVAACKWRLYNR